MRRMLFRPWPISNLSSQFWPNLHLVAGIPCVRAASKDSATQGTGPVSKPYPLPKGKERQARDAALPPNRIHPTARARRSARARRWANEFPADRGPGLPSRHDCRDPAGIGKPLGILRAEAAGRGHQECIGATHAALSAEDGQVVPTGGRLDGQSAHGVNPSQAESKRYSMS